ncbi:MAG TPA: hypothetical protein VHJ39_00920 [Solirubrobacteraceae bacterium]|nr:hypothetical protein [Solirubrobacteraceae bacterium]
MIGGSAGLEAVLWTIAALPVPAALPAVTLRPCRPWWLAPD